MFYKVRFYWRQVGVNRNIWKLRCGPLPFTWYKTFLKRKRSGTSLSTLFSTLFLKKKIFLLFIIFSGQTSMSGYLYFVRYLAICVWAFFYMTIKPRHKFKYPENNELLRWIHQITGLWFKQIISTMINKVVSKQDKVNLNANLEDTFLKIGIVLCPPFCWGGGLSLWPNFQKREELIGSQFTEGSCWERWEMTFFRLEEGCEQFLHEK